MDGLDKVLAEVWALLAEGAAEPGSPWRILTLANVNAQGPALRSVVLRAVAPAERIAVIHSDRRSPKVAALIADPRAALLGWDAVRRVQIRLDGMMMVAGEMETDAAWASLSESSRATYAGALAPGAEISGPDLAMGMPDRAVFAVLRLAVTAVDHLSLARGGNRRARFVWDGPEVSMTWLAP